eukprot:GGOE01001301.1.p1 GENE.GGOE01001301.1~~GGOE01001301.1.p1  ORF type:complete len:646 (-),score=191.41 GGOE01001301.1:383-2281(-)
MSALAEAPSLRPSLAAIPNPASAALAQALAGAAGLGSPFAIPNVAAAPAPPQPLLGPAAPAVASKARGRQLYSGRHDTPSLASAVRAPTGVRIADATVSAGGSPSALQSSSPVQHAGVATEGPGSVSPPFVDGNKLFIGGSIIPWKGESLEVTSPIVDIATGKRIRIGQQAQLGVPEALQALKAASQAWAGGLGEWPQMSVPQRCDRMRQIVAELKKKRSQIVEVLQWEICKTTADAEKEFDRTMEYIQLTIDALLEEYRRGKELVTDGGIVGQLSRGPLGVLLCMGPFNYPFNETYCQFIPALLMGNTVVMKIPTTGGLAHILTMEAFQQCLPRGVVNFVSGGGRVILPAMMQSGLVDVLAFIGGSSSADALIKAHPNPHKLRVSLGLDAKNVAVIMPDADLDVAVQECLLGSTSYNGQRCTAIKLIFAHKSIAQQFTQRLAAAVDQLQAGLPWQKGVAITPLPAESKPAYIHALIRDAQQHGARVINAKGGATHGGLVFPAVLFPVNRKMRVWEEEQFGPVVPVATFDRIGEVVDWLQSSIFGQQGAIFTSDLTAPESAQMLRALGASVSRVNINTQCARSPDTFPFTGRHSSANGTLSVKDALRAFSIEEVRAGKATVKNTKLLSDATA